MLYRKNYLTHRITLLVIGLLGVYSACYSKQQFNQTIQKLVDPTTPSNFDWARPYFGGYLGGAWGASNFSTAAGTESDVSYFTTQEIDSVSHYGSGSTSTSAFIGGLRVGKDLQTRNSIYGLVLNFGSFHLEKSKNVSNAPYTDFPANYSLETNIDTDWLFTARGRLGITLGVSGPLAYATAGLALTKIKVSNTFSDTALAQGVGGTVNSMTQPGYAAGGGIELPFSKNFSMYGEYLYINLNSVTASSSVGCLANFCAGLNSSPFVTNAGLAANLFVIGLNYRLA